MHAASLAFQDMKISGSAFESGVFSDVLFRNFESDNVNFLDANFTYCKFDDVRIEGSNFSGAIFSKCIFEGASFRGCDFTDSVFSECDFTNAAVYGGSLRRALLTRCDLTNLQLMKGPPRAGGASRRLQVDTDLDNIELKFSENIPESIVAHLSIQDVVSSPNHVTWP